MLDRLEPVSVEVPGVDGHNDLAGPVAGVGDRGDDGPVAVGDDRAGDVQTR
jgi:hypothetical protein